MSYTGSHLHNFIPGVATAPMTAEGPDRRAVRPLSDTAAAAAVATNRTAPPASSSPSPSAGAAQAQTTHLEAHVRMLEQEVQLLRSGLAQNERLRQSAAPPSPAKRVHFGPASVVPIPGVARGAGAGGGCGGSAAARHAGRRVSTSPLRQAHVKPSASTRPAGAAAAAAGIAPYDDRPKLAFGQRVEPTQPRSAASHASGAPAAAPTSGARSPLPSADANSNVSGGGGAPATSPAMQSTSPSAPVAANSTTYVPLSHAPASLRGSNTCGVPLHGAATGATVVAALDGPAAAPVSSPSLPSSAMHTSAATVWAAADPALLWKRAAAAASAGAVDGGSSTSSPSAIAHYPFRVEASEPVVKAVTTTPAAPPVSASPIVVTMSSEGWPPRTTAAAAAASALPQPQVQAEPAMGGAAGGVAASPPSHVEAPAPPVAAPAVGAGDAQSATADAAAVSAAAASSRLVESPADPRVEGLQREVAALRDTLEQREALLHRVLVELHDCSHNNNNNSSNSSALRTPSATSHQDAADARAEQSRRTLRLLTQELLAVQTQLSHAKVSYQLLQEEVHRCPSSPQPAPQPAAPSPPPAPPARDDAQLRSQLDAALQKVKAWEEWYATTKANVAAQPTDAAAAASTENATEKHHRKKSKAAEAAQPQRQSRGCGDEDCWGYCGSPALSAAAAACYDRASVTAAAAAPLSAYAMDDALYSQLIGNGNSSSRGSPSAGFHTGGVRQSRAGGGAAASMTDVSAKTPVAAGAASMNNGTLSAHPITSSSSYFCDDLDHARKQAAYGEHFATQMAREAAVRELAEAERRVAEERLALLRHHAESAATPPAADGGDAPGRREAVDEK